MNKQAFERACATYGVVDSRIKEVLWKQADDPGFAQQGLVSIAANPDLQNQRTRAGVTSAFDAHAQIDPTSSMPNSSVSNNRLQG